MSLPTLLWILLGGATGAALFPRATLPVHVAGSHPVSWQTPERVFRRRWRAAAPRRLLLVALCLAAAWLSFLPGRA